MPATSQTTPICIDRIRDLVPHSGKMCLLEQVVEFNVESILCETHSHKDPGNPLRRKGHLSSLCAIEYAAQAMALHAALVTGSAPGTQAPNPDPAPHGYLASVRHIRCHVRYLDTVKSALDVRADYVFGDAGSMVYSFAITAGKTKLVTGRASVMLGSMFR